MMLPHINSMIDSTAVSNQLHPHQEYYHQPHQQVQPQPPTVQQLPVLQGQPQQNLALQRLPPPPQIQDGHYRQTGTTPDSSGRKRKRAKYVARACAECKRRKVKCNGESRCDRCTKMNLECVYRGLEEYTQRKTVWNGIRPDNRQEQLSKVLEADNSTNIPSTSSNSQYLDSNRSATSINNGAASSAYGSAPSSSPGPVLSHQHLPTTSTTYPTLPRMAQFTPLPAPLPRSHQFERTHIPMSPNHGTSVRPPKLLKHVSDQSLSGVSTPSDRSSRSTSVGYGSLSTLSPAASDMNNSNRRPASLPKPARAWGKDEAKSFSGPTSSSFPFQQATRILDSERMGQARVDNKESDEEDDEEQSEESEVEDDDQSTATRRKLSAAKSKENKKFLYIDHLEARRLIQVYESEINCMYPIFEVQELDTKYEDFRQYYEHHGLNFPNAQDLSVVKIILAIATSVTETHVTEGRKLYEEVLKMTERKIVAGTADVYTLISLWLIHNYQFHTDLESLAYRTICFCAILAIELGLHQSSKMSQMFPDPMQRERCRALFWCVYVVDRRMAFSTGRPFTLRDEDIDQELPQTYTRDDEISDDKRVRALYLNAMIKYSEVAGRVWKTVSAFNPPRHFTINTGEIDYIEFLIHRWKHSLPPDLNLHSAIHGQQHPSPTQFSGKLQAILYLRHNLMFLHLYRPVLFSTRTIAEHMPYALRAVEIALDSIRVLSRLHFETDLYASCQIHYNYFLVSALGVLFTAIIHAPAVFAAPCKQEFNMALDLIKLFSKVSRVGRRLWATVKKLRSVTAAYGIGTYVAKPGPSSASIEGAGNQEVRNATPASVPAHVNSKTTSQPAAAHVSTYQSGGYSAEPSTVDQHMIMPAGVAPPSQTDKPNASVFDGMIGNQTDHKAHQLDDQDQQYVQGDYVSPLAVSATSSSIDGQNLSTEISDLFNFMAADPQPGTSYSVPTVPVMELVDMRQPRESGAHAPSAARVPQMPVKQEQIGYGYTPLGMEAAQVAQMLAQGAKGESTWDDELFRLIDNLF
ncbi:fungal-specific transcription factor domain-containing protein [Lipomyces orientalis]|uniref:Fungal-specific transcription factor domain-containing protein n=1 Tax=Lipomyces orientalis TaxID=1233043 RepID=A0ACC3TYK1_9ASCO